MPKGNPSANSQEFKSFPRRIKETRKRSRHGNETAHGKQYPSKKSKKPLAGLVVSVSTLNEKGSGALELTYSSVVQICKELGAEVLGQVGKRVQYMICTDSAVRQATQRVRKAVKKNIPVVNVSWLEECRQEQCRVEIQDYRLDEEAAKSIESRHVQNEVANSNNISFEVAQDEIPPGDAAWTDAVALGCCCVCHENRAEKDCKWCKNLGCATKT